MKSLFIILCISFSCHSQGGSAQSWNSLTDNSFDYFADDETTRDTVKKHSVLTATLLSVGIPGAGQIYNHLAMPKGKKKAFWKVPLIYAGLGATGYFLITNQQQVTSLKKEYTFMDNNGGEHTEDSEWAPYDQAGVLELYGQYQTWRDLSILGLIFVYALQVVDAGVEAHFVTFDVSQDLTLGLDPVMVDRRTAGLMFTLNFR
ncbi:MAG: DUF5683 domain-containing protein [Crocinitomicaceae bacterium]|nr:DUF5683 domain-containing protein [Crocinitomicaceae bacterium]